MRSLITFGLGLFLITGCSSPEIKNIDSWGSSIVFLGDTVSAANGVGEGETFPALIAKKTNFPVINISKVETSSQTVERLSDVFLENPMMVVIVIGATDFINGVSVEETKENLELIVFMVQRENAIAVIVSPDSGILLRNYLAVCREVADSYGAVLIPHVLSGVSDSQKYKIGRVQPNADGHKIVAKRVWKYLKPVIELNHKQRSM